VHKLLKSLPFRRAFYLRKKSGQFLLIFDNKDNLWGNGGKSAKFVFGVRHQIQTPNTKRH
jgi:hypothetical protein